MGGPGPRQPLPEGRPGEGRGGPWPAHHTPARPRPPGTAAGSHTAAPGGHTGPHRRSVRARRSSEAAGWMAGARGLGPSTLEVDWPALWAGAGVRWAGGGCASPGVGRGGTGWDGVGGPSRLTWDWLAVVRQDEVVQAHDAPWACLPSQEDLGTDGVGGAPAPLCDPQAGLPPNPLARIHTSSLALAGHPALQRASLQGALPSSGLPSS